MIYNFSLQQVGLTVGLALLVTHLIAFLQPALTSRLLLSFPRSQLAGFALLAIAALWSAFLVQTMDLGEFSPARFPLLISVPILALLVAIFPPEFLAVRTLGTIALLAAEPVLSAAFLNPAPSRLLIVSLAYLWIFAGLFWVGIPWLLRDQISWLSQSLPRLRLAALAGATYGLLLIILAATLW